ncbi:hypothetical protein BLOT_005111 [Blomia tropicalis]|nr:hypothetical protein BLOT_005111 [Blomia tropicalis]
MSLSASKQTTVLLLNSISYSWSNAHSILSDINLSVNHGDIFGLLGASGCGKTTLVRLILGRLSPSSGIISLLNNRIDGPRNPPKPIDIGYMPQDLVLYQEFTPVEMLIYFGKLYKLSSSDIKTRIEFVLRLLNLKQFLSNDQPSGSKLINQLSGGQKRRISLAIALLHQPKFLILDEPTVGNSLPLLDSQTSAHILSPLNVFTNKTKIDPAGFDRSSTNTKFPQIFTVTHMNRKLSSLFEHSDSYTITGISRKEHFICLSHLLTLMQKNLRQLRRNQSLLIFFILLPAIEIALIMLCIGRDIVNIPIAIYNGEKPHDLSEVFLSSVPKDAFIRQDYESATDALKAVEENRAHALLEFSPRFSNALRTRFFTFGFDEETVMTTETKNVTDETNVNIWNESSVYVRLDMSNQLIGLQVQRQLLAAFLNFAQRLASNLGLSNHTFKPPIVFGPPVYGIQGGASAVVETFIAPGALIMIAFFATTIVTCHLLIHEVRQALIERALIAGASSAEFLFSHIIIQSTILMIQLLLMLFTAFKLFEMPYLGSLWLAICLIILQGLCGLMYGLMLSATCPDEIYATTLAIGTFFPSVIIGGIFWPVQSMPQFLQYVSQCLPSTQSIDALRSILLRDWGLNTLNVAGAFIVSTIWLLIFLFAALRNFKRRI